MLEKVVSLKNKQEEVARIVEEATGRNIFCQFQFYHLSCIFSCPSEILPPHVCSVCFITFVDSCKANLVLANFDKKVRIRSDPPPPPLVGPKDQLFPFFFFEGSPNFDV